MSISSLIPPTTPLPSKIVPATRTPRIGDLVTEAIIFRWAKQRAGDMVSEMPCHPLQIGSVRYQDGHQMEVDQMVVCRSCGILYLATPVPSSADTQPKIQYRCLGQISMSRPKQAQRGSLPSRPK